MIEELAALREDNARLQKIVDTVDDMLIVNWFTPPKDGNYRQALHDLVGFELLIENDYRVSKPAAERRLMELRSAKFLFTGSLLESELAEEICKFSGFIGDWHEIPAWIDTEIDELMRGLAK